MVPPTNMPYIQTKTESSPHKSALPVTFPPICIINRLKSGIVLAPSNRAECYCKLAGITKKIQISAALISEYFSHENAAKVTVAEGIVESFHLSLPFKDTSFFPKMKG